MSALCSFCVHYVAVSGEAVNSNDFKQEFPAVCAALAQREKIVV